MIRTQTWVTTTPAHFQHVSWPKRQDTEVNTRKDTWCKEEERPAGDFSHDASIYRENVAESAGQLLKPQERLVEKLGSSPTCRSQLHFLSSTVDSWIMWGKSSRLENTYTAIQCRELSLTKNPGDLCKKI